MVSHFAIPIKAGIRTGSTVRIYRPPGLRVQRSALKSLHENRSLSGNSAESTFNNQAPPLRKSKAIFIHPIDLGTNEILDRRLIICLRIRA